MGVPHLTFFCELDSQSLQDLFTDSLISQLVELKATISLGILDHRPERAAVVRRLNQAGIPVTAWLLLPREQGYWFNLRNATQAVESYTALKRWTRENDLRWEAVGLDIEPDINELERLASGKLHLLPVLLQRAVQGEALRSGQQAYRQLSDQIRSDGYRVESYQFFLVADERAAHSTLVQRVTGIVDFPVDREVWMLYTSFWRSFSPERGGQLGPGMLNSYGAEAGAEGHAIGLGSTGGGVEIDLGDQRPLTWDELARDLRLAYYWTQNIYIFSLEGCVRQGFLEKLENFSWDQPILLPEASTDRVNDWRRAFQGVLWFSSHLQWVFGFTAATVFFLFALRRVLRKRMQKEH